MKFFEVTTWGSFTRTTIVPVPDNWEEEDVNIHEIAWTKGEVYDENDETDDSEYKEIPITDVEQLKYLGSWLESHFPEEYKEFISVPSSDLSKLMNKVYDKEKAKKEKKKNGDVSN